MGTDTVDRFKNYRNSLNISNITICNDKTLSLIELNSFLYYNLERVVNYYNEFNREVEYEFKTNSKRSLAKQIK